MSSATQVYASGTISQDCPSLEPVTAAFAG